MITGDQVKWARELLGWSQDDLGGHARVSAKTVGDVERGNERQSDWIIDAIQDALEGAGVEFPDGEQVRKKGAP